jgi:hypothetical protein
MVYAYGYTCVVQLSFYAKDMKRHLCRQLVPCIVIKQYKMNIFSFACSTDYPMNFYLNAINVKNI